MHVVATAGHVDHGKSALAEALTGTDPDRLEEEHRRGLSIQLGYCWTTLEPVGEVAFVDVPGHERFITTMLSGIGPVPAVLFVVAADDPWMPQAAEHLAALDALGVSRGLLVVTRSDLADPAPATARARHELAGTSLADVASVAVSARTGAGLDELRTLLADLLRAGDPPDSDADVRLWVDRRFHVRGAGTVVTGTLPAGTLRVGQTLTCDGRVIRVRGIETLGRTEQTVSGVARVALNLGGPVPASLAAGSALVTPDAFEPSAVLDVRLTVAGRLPERPMLHVGSAAVAVRTRRLDDRHVRLTVAGPLPLRIGDRVLLRDPGSRTVWGADVLDPAPPDLRRRGAPALRAEELTVADGSVADELARRAVVRRGLLVRLGVDVHDLPPGTVEGEGWLVSPGRAGSLREQLTSMVSEAGPGGVPTAALARALDLPDERLVSPLVTPPLHVTDGWVRTEVDLPPEAQRTLDALSARLADAPFAAPDAELLRSLPGGARSLTDLVRAGLLVRVADGVYLLPGADDLAVDRLHVLPQPFTVSQARTALATSRRVVLPLLARLDRAGRTVRLPDDTRRLRP